MSDAGDVLLFALSASRCWSWRTFKSTFDEVYVRKARISGTKTEEPDQHHRRRTLMLMDSLAHCDVSFHTDGSEVCVAPPVLAALPTPGLPRAALCGARSPDTVQSLRSAAGRKVRIRVATQSTTSDIVPTRIEIEADSHSALNSFAEAADVPYVVAPTAWSLAHFTGSLAHYLELLQWSTRPDLTWPRSDFDPARLRFAGVRSDSSNLTLARYQDPVRGRFLFRLWKEGSSADVDPAWGRYAILQDREMAVVTYQSHGALVGVPATVPLPRLVARALTLCSGYAPVQRSRGEAMTSPPSQCDMYRSVPLDVYRLCMTKLGQTGPISSE